MKESMESHLPVFCILFGIVAASQSVVVSCIVGTVGAWTKRSSRGVLMGIWSTCGAVGNIVGLQVASLVLGRHEGQWQRLQYVIAATFFALAVVILIAFVSEPREVAINMEEDHISVASNTASILNDSVLNSQDDRIFSSGRRNRGQRRRRTVAPLSLVSQPSIEDASNPRIGFCEAFKTPNVVYWGLCFFCIKFAVYSLLLWMPLFLDQELDYEKQA